ncbi:MAG: hypothetical protein LPK25_13110 [Cyclobacteriaceae bacterium]|mgnify:CR=1 FL=1|nr:hypothetical protein [Cyclobacteriaceae bacterium]MDX5467454.1 hypothetical protein [Cyclobacteriaceae bacterium]
MKRLFLVLFFLLTLTFASLAQLQKGSWMLDGQVGLSLNRQNNESLDSPWGAYTLSSRNKQFTLSPGLGYFVRDHWALGLSPSFAVGWGKGESGNNSQVKGNSFDYGIAVFSRKYIPAGERLFFYGDFRFGGFWGDSGWKDNGASDRMVLTENKGIEANASLGLQYMVREHLGIHLQSTLIDYWKRTVNGVAFEGSETRESLSVRLFSSFQIGATVFF